MPCIDLSIYSIVKRFVFFQTEQNDVVFIQIHTFHIAVVVKRVFYSAFVWKCTDMCKYRFRVQLLQNPPLCSSVIRYLHKIQERRTEEIYCSDFAYNQKYYKKKIDLRACFQGYEIRLFLNPKISCYANR
jgi:hypothetical protein